MCKFPTKSVGIQDFFSLFRPKYLVKALGFNIKDIFKAAFSWKFVQRKSWDLGSIWSWLWRKVDSKEKYFENERMQNKKVRTFLVRIWVKFKLILHKC